MLFGCRLLEQEANRKFPISYFRLLSTISHHAFSILAAYFRIHFRRDHYVYLLLPICWLFFFYVCFPRCWWMIIYYRYSYIPIQLIQTNKKSVKMCSKGSKSNCKDTNGSCFVCIPNSSLCVLTFCCDNNRPFRN